MKLVNLMNRNLARNFSLILVAMLFALTACQPGDELNILSEEDEELVVQDAAAEADYEEVTDFSLEAMEITDHSNWARLFQRDDYALTSGNGCPTIDHDSAAKTITVDFGIDCVGDDGKTRSGKIIITYTKRLYHPGASLEVKLENYEVDDKQIEGTWKIENTMTSYQDHISMKTSLMGGKITWPDGTFATRDFVRSRTWVRGNNPGLDEFHVDGNFQATRRNGNSYSCDITSTLIRKRKCRRQGVRIPVEGTKLIKRSNRPDVLVDFGDGTCDHLITVTINGHSHTVDVRNR